MVKFGTIKVGQGCIYPKDRKSWLYLRLDPEYSHLGNCVNEEGKIITLDDETDVYEIYAIDY